MTHEMLRDHKEHIIGSYWSAKETSLPSQSFLTNGAYKYKKEEKCKKSSINFYTAVPIVNSHCKKSMTTTYISLFPNFKCSYQWVRQS